MLSVDRFEKMLNVLERATGFGQPVSQAHAEILFASQLNMDKREWQVSRATPHRRAQCA
jgi:hypothetical protein